MQPIPWRSIGLAILSGLLQILPFPIGGPVPFWRTAFCWIALVPLLFALTNRPSGERPLSLLQASVLGYSSGIVWYLGNCYWIFQTMHLYGGLPQPVALAILFLFALYLGLYHALFALLIAALRRSHLGSNGALLLAPFVWVAVELARARITGFPWDLLGYTQIDNAFLARLAPFTGVFGISFVIVVINSLWLVRLRVRDRPYTRPALTVAGVVFVAAYVVFLHRLQSPAQNVPTASATLVQENLSVGAESRAQPLDSSTELPETTTQLMQSFADLSVHPGSVVLAGIPGLPGTPQITLQRRDPAAPVSPDLIVWPEAPSSFFTNDPAFRTRMNALAASSRALLIVGSIGVVPNPADPSTRPYFTYDSASFFTPDGSSQARYDKIHLVPWGEYIPFKQFFFFARKLTAGVGDMDRGTQRTVFRNDGHALATFICYESIFADEVRLFVKNGAEVLVNISDDGWYGDSGAPWQHLTMVRMRALENHRWILRSTNTGITSVINPLGHVVLAAPRHIRTSLHVPFGYQQDITFYTAHGDWFAYLCALTTLLALARILTARRRQKA